MKKIQLAMVAAALVVATQARATLFDITFTSNDGQVIGSGTLDGTLTSTPGVYEATSGSFDITTGPDGAADGFTASDYLLYLDPSGSVYPGHSTSPSGYFLYDNAVLNGQNPFLSNDGLLYQGTGGNTLELNLFSNGPSSPAPDGTYQLYESNGHSVFGNATLSAAPVPEASTMLAGALMLLPLGVSAARIMRKNVLA